MLIYGSYISDKENLPVIGGLVALLDIGIAVIAGLLILPAMYVALSNGVEIFDLEGELIAGPSLIVSVLPTLFDSMGTIGIGVSLAFFLLMTIASLTSSISMLEVPVSYAIEYHGINRKRAAAGIGTIVTFISLVIVLNFDPLFKLEGKGKALKLIRSISRCKFVLTTFATKSDGFSPAVRCGYRRVGLAVLLDGTHLIEGRGTFGSIAGIADLCVVFTIFLPSAVTTEINTDLAGGLHNEIHVVGRITFRIHMVFIAKNNAVTVSNVS